MIKNVSGVEHPGEREGYEIAGSETRNTISDVSPLNFRVQKRRQTLSKNNDRRQLIDSGRGFLSSYIEIDEIKLYFLASSRYRRGDPLKALRSIHRMYPKTTRLFLRDGIWVLEPVVEARP